MSPLNWWRLARNTWNAVWGLKHSSISDHIPHGPKLTGERYEGPPVVAPPDAPRIPEGER